MSAREDHSETNFRDPSRKPRKRVFIVDDHPLVRNALVGLIEREPDLEVCGQAGNVSEALDGIARLQPDLVVTDISMPGRSGLELIAELKLSLPQIAVLAISTYDETVYAERVLMAGGRGYISKHETLINLLNAIREVLEGRVHFNPKILNGLLGRMCAATTASSSVLSSRELEVLELLGKGKNSHVIAAELQLSAKTVDAHRQHIKEKLNLKTGTAVTCYAARWVNSKSAQAPLSSPNDDDREPLSLKV